MAHPENGEPIITSVPFPRVDGTIRLTDILRRLEDTASVRAGAAPPAVGALMSADRAERLQRVADLARQLAEEIEHLPEENLS